MVGVARAHEGAQLVPRVRLHLLAFEWRAPEWPRSRRKKVPALPVRPAQPAQPSQHCLPTAHRFVFFRDGSFEKHCWPDRRNHKRYAYKSSSDLRNPLRRWSEWGEPGAMARLGVVSEGLGDSDGE